MVVSGADASLIADDLTSTKATALLDIFLPVGFVIAILLVDRMHHARLRDHRDLQNRTEGPLARRGVRPAGGTGRCPNHTPLTWGHELPVGSGRV